MEAKNLKINLPDADAVKKYNLPFALSAVEGFEALPETAKYISGAVGRLAFTTIGEQIPASIVSLMEVIKERKFPNNGIFRGKLGKGPRTYQFSITVADVRKAYEAIKFLDGLRASLLTQIDGPAPEARKAGKREKAVEPDVVVTLPTA